MRCHYEVNLRLDAETGWIKRYDYLVYDSAIIIYIWYLLREGKTYHYWIALIFNNRATSLFWVGTEMINATEQAESDKYDIVLIVVDTSAERMEIL